MNIEEYRRSRNKNGYSNRFKKVVSGFISRVLLTIIVFLGGLIITKNNASVKDFINKNVYTTNFKFAQAKELYNKYFGKYVADTPKDTQVFSEKIAYSESSIYKDGVKLVVASNYLVPALESGIVVFMGNKDEYGNTLIVEQIDGVEVWYANIDIKDIKMYDYIEKGSLIGEAIDEKLYLLFQKDGKYLNYKEYL